MVYVIAIDGTPLMPCSNVIARLLLKQGKAKVKYCEPFTIKLTYETTKYTQDLTLGVDTGSGTLGTAVATPNNKIIYMSEVTLRNNIANKMKERASFRCNRRNRKTRYRPARWLNRKNSKSKNRFSPTMISKLHSHVKEIEFIKSILPIKGLVLETGKFDPHLMQNPSLANPVYKHWGYQKGPNYGFANTKALVLNRDNYTCQLCKNTKKSDRLEVHHIVYRSQNGSDDSSNLITLCHSCHTKIHKSCAKINLMGSIKSNLKYATQMNSIRIQLLKLYPNAIETFGYVTKANNISNNVLAKEHCYDACMIATGGMPYFVDSNKYIKVCVPSGDLKQTMGERSEIKIPTGKIAGYRKFDKVKYLGKYYFIKGRYGNGKYVILMDIYGNTIKFDYMPRGFKTPKVALLKRMRARSSWMIMTEVPSASTIWEHVLSSLQNTGSPSLNLMTKKSLLNKQYLMQKNQSNALLYKWNLELTTYIYCLNTDLIYHYQKLSKDLNNSVHIECGSNIDLSCQKNIGREIFYGLKDTLSVV